MDQDRLPIIVGVGQVNDRPADPVAGMDPIELMAAALRKSESDAGASLIGEFAFGTNPHVTAFTKDILIDEKIGGTVHIALGRSYPESGGDNRSAIHWDIIKDIRREGAVYVDDRLVLEGGVFHL